LIVVCEDGRDKYGMGLWKCACNCGNRPIVTGHNLRNGAIRSCGCLHKEKVSGYMKNRIVSKETRQKLSKAHKGKKFSEEHKRKLSESHIGLQAGKKHPMYGANRSGKNNGNYKHGLTGTNEYNNVHAAKRRAIRLNQTPINASMVEINEIYATCSIMNEISVGIKWEVDHIIPLSKGGLHHQDNLQILTMEANRRKFNKLVIGDF